MKILLEKLVLHLIQNTQQKKYNDLLLLGSEDLGFYVFRTLMCIVGKP